MTHTEPSGGCWYTVVWGGGLLLAATVILIAYLVIVGMP